MSDFRAIATVTATLQRALQGAIQAEVNGATVTTVRPAEGPNTNLPDTGVNIFLYQVSTNPHWGNADLPTRRPGGELVHRPRAALDLHYLFSFYGDELALEPQRLLGSTAAFLHSQPLLTRAQIGAAVASAPFLAGSDLAEQADLVRFAPLNLSLEEMTRLWSVFLQVQYVLSVTYQASVVLIERQVTPRPALPTREFNVAAIPLRPPFITRVMARDGQGTPIVPGSPLVVEGQDLQADVVRVEIDGMAVATTHVGAGRIELFLPPTLAAGQHSLQVRHGLVIGAPNVEHMAFSSNLSTFVLQPVVTRTNGPFDIAVTDVQGSGGAPRAASVTMGVAPTTRPRQTATLELLVPQGVVHTFMARPRIADADELLFDMRGVGAGEYVLRVRVDGAESPLELDANRVPVAPKVTVP